MLVLDRNELAFRFPEVHPEAECRVHFQRTLRIPDDNREQPLPAGLGQFSLSRVEDYADGLPLSWREHGGVFLPMYQAEAMWISFRGLYPFVVKIAVGNTNGLSGEAWKTGLTSSPQNYLVIPEQPWLDGFCMAEGWIRQFVAMPLGERLSDASGHGDLRIVVCPMKGTHYERMRRRCRIGESDEPFIRACVAPPVHKGLATDGLMSRDIYDDPHGLAAWEISAHSRCTVRLVNAVQYRDVTGTVPPTAPPSAEEYASAGIPWFDHYAADIEALGGAAKLTGLDNVAIRDHRACEKPVMPRDVAALATAPAQRRSCPKCGRLEGVPIAYGLPGEEMIAAAQRGEIVLGGCCLEAANTCCRHCGHEWARQTLGGRASRASPH